jgi:conjugal transfer mating pair stabilization protein TraN
MIKLNSIIRIALYALYAAFIYLNPVHASNFVCAQDLDGNGDIDGIGENASCQTIGTEQFCSIGAQVCNIEPTYDYKCSLDDLVYDNKSACKSSCKELTPTSTSPFKVGSCSKNNNISNTYSCPTAGKSCVDVGGIQKCAINPCIDLDVTPPEDITPSSHTEIDDGKRNVDGACMEQPLMFSGRNSSCKYSGVTKNCCKNTDTVYRDSSGSILSNSAKSLAITQTYEAISAAYTAYTTSLSAGATIATSSAAASGAAQSAFVGVDPYSIAIAVAIQVITKMIACGQQDTETAMLNGSGYCHFIATFCSKKWPTGCVQKSKSYCCFNSKLGRILQEQGRAQMGKGWGSPTNPSCGGFTPDEFQSLDFSRIDLTEYYGDIKSKGDSLIQKNITDGVNNYYQQIQR